MWDAIVDHERRTEPHALGARVSIGALNMSLRGAGLIGRFGLMLYMARYLGFASVGLFGLIYACVAMALPILSFGLHYRTNRFFVDASSLDIGHRLRDRFFLHLIVYIPLAFVAFAGWRVFADLPEISDQLILSTLVICILEVLLSEIHLALISSRHPILANVVFFIRNAAWIFPFAGLSWVFPSLRSIETLCFFWISGQLVALLTFFTILKDWPWREIGSRKSDLIWLLQSYRRSALLWLSDIGLSTGQFIDRFILGLFLDINSIAVYIFFWSMANGVQQLVYTAVVQVAVPHFVSTARTADRADFRRLLLSEMRNVLVVAVLIGAAVFAAAPILYLLAGRMNLADYNMLFGAILVGVVIRLVSDVVGSGVYARGHDVRLASINMATPLVSAAITTAALLQFGFEGIGWAFITTNLVVFAMRVYSLREDFLP